MKVLIVHAHPEPKSFCSALSNRAKEVLIKEGHEAIVSDLYAIRFNPVSDRSNFTTVKDPAYFKQQMEEMYANENDGFAQDLDAEMKKLEDCDALIFSFPLWWFGMPAILKGWCDRVLAMGRIYGGGNFFEAGLGQSKKRAMLITTTGGGPNVYDGWGLNPSLESLLQPVQQGIFWFNGFLPLEPFVAWSVSRISQSEREEYLKKLEEKISVFFEEQTLSLPLMADFPSWGPDNKNRYRVVAKRIAPIDDKFKSLVSAEQQMLAELKREGVLMDFEMSAPDDPEWRAFIKMRASDDGELHKHLQRLPLAAYLHFDVTKLRPLARVAELISSR